MKTHAARKSRVRIELFEQQHFILDHFRKVIPSMTVGVAGGQVVVRTGIIIRPIVVIENVVIGFDERRFITHGQMVVLNRMDVVNAPPGINVQEPALFVFGSQFGFLECLEKGCFSRCRRRVGVYVRGVLCLTHLTAVSAFAVSGLMMNTDNSSRARHLLNEPLDFGIIRLLNHVVGVLDKVLIGQ